MTTVPKQKLDEQGNIKMTRKGQNKYYIPATFINHEFHNSKTLQRLVSKMNAYHVFENKIQS